MIHSVTIGSCINSLQHAYQNKTKLILNQLAFPDRFEPSYVKSAWGLLYTKLMLEGQIVGGDTVKKIRVSDDYIQVVCESNVVNKLEYDKLSVFSDVDIIGLPETTKITDEYKVVDVLKTVSLITKYNKKILETEDKLVNRLYILKQNSTSAIEAYAVSTLTSDELLDFGFSDTMVKFKSEDLLKENNFEGSVIGFDRAPIELEVVTRIVRKKMDMYEDTEKIKFIYGL